MSWKVALAHNMRSFCSGPKISTQCAEPTKIYLTKDENDSPSHPPSTNAHIPMNFPGEVRRAEDYAPPSLQLTSGVGGGGVEQTTHVHLTMIPKRRTAVHVQPINNIYSKEIHKKNAHTPADFMTQVRRTAHCTVPRRQCSPVRRVPGRGWRTALTHVHVLTSKKFTKMYRNENDTKTPQTHISRRISERRIELFSSTRAGLTGAVAGGGA